MILKQISYFWEDSLVFHVFCMFEDNFCGVFQLLALVDSDCVEGMQTVVHGGEDVAGGHYGEELFAQFGH